MCENEHHSNKNCNCYGGILRGFIKPRILLLLAKHPAHGYELLETLNQVDNFVSTDAGNLYRILRKLEDEGLLQSNWETGSVGPARRVYQITKNGKKFLNEWVENVSNTREQLDQFLNEYEALFVKDVTKTGTNLQKQTKA